MNEHRKYTQEGLQNVLKRYTQAGGHNWAGCNCYSQIGLSFYRKYLTTAQKTSSSFFGSHFAACTMESVKSLRILLKRIELGTRHGRGYSKLGCS
jgi:hypothetical protein